MLSGRTVSGLTTKIVGQIGNTSAWSHVQFSHDSSGSNIQPVRVRWSELLEGAGLGISGPFWLSDLISFLQIFGEFCNPVVARNVLNGDEICRLDSEHRYLRFCVVVNYTFPM